MEKSTVIGIVLGFVSVFVGMVLKGAPISSLNNPAAFLIIIGGTFACLFIGFRVDQMKNFPKLIKMTFKAPAMQEKSELLRLFIELSQIARREGILALENKVSEIQDPFFRTGLGMVIDGMDPDFVSDVLDAELQIMQERHSEARSMFTQAGTYAPTLGVLGAVVGLIAALGNLKDIDKLGHSIAAAFIATLLGIFTGYVLWLPFANKLKIMSEAEIGQKRMIIEGILSLQAGDSPTAIEAKLMVFIPQTARESLKKEGCSMARKKRGKPHEEEASEAWLLPYSDLLTLLLALFLCLFAMSQTDQTKVAQMAQAFTAAFNSGGPSFFDKAGPNAGRMAEMPSDEDKGNSAYIQENQQLEGIKKTLDQYINQNHMQDELNTELTEDGLMIRIKEKALFPSGSADLVPESQRIGPIIAGLLAPISERVIISGHTDNVPISNARFPSNWELSSSRALNFMKFILAQDGRLQPARFSATGCSEYRPVASNSTEEGRTQNRRVEVLIARAYQPDKNKMQTIP